MINFGAVPAGSVLPVFFSTYGRVNGESVTLTGLAVTDVEIYKGVSMTQRASDVGYTLLDTDGIDVDGLTGIHAFSIDTGDNTDAGFFAAGSFYNVVVSAVTIDGQTVNFIAATFNLRAAEAIAGVAKVDVTHNAGTAVTAAAGIQEVKVASIAANAVDAAAIATDAVTEIQSGLATTAALATVAGFIDTEVSAVKAVTDLLIATHAEPAGVPAANETPLDKIGYVFAALRNRVDVTATKKLFYNDAGTVEWEKDLSDNGTTYTETEGNAP